MYSAPFSGGTSVGASAHFASCTVKVFFDFTSLGLCLIVVICPMGRDNTLGVTLCDFVKVSSSFMTPFTDVEGKGSLVMDNLALLCEFEMSAKIRSSSFWITDWR